MKDIIVIPTYNEKENIEKLIETIMSINRQLHILIADDNSPDGTGDVVRTIMSHNKNVSLITREQKDGLGGAYINAFKSIIEDATVNTITTMDADFSHDPVVLHSFLKEIETKDVVIGSRYISGGAISNWNIIRRLISRFGNLYARLWIRIGIKDMTAGFMMIRREKLLCALSKKLDQSGFAFLIELKLRLIRDCKSSFKEIPIIFTERVLGSPKFNSKIFLEGLLLPPALFFKSLFH